MIDDILKEFDDKFPKRYNGSRYRLIPGGNAESIGIWLSQKLTAYGEEQRREGYDEGYEAAFEKHTCID